MIRKQIQIFGCVQGVGFRPFIFRAAQKFNLKGYVRNTRYGAEIMAEGEEENLQSFLHYIQKELPPGGIILELRVREHPLAFYPSFQIKKSLDTQPDYTVLPPDSAMCPECERELFSEENRRFMYPFTNCTACGARFSIILKHPYDRPNTSMKEFPLCEDCLKEYQNPASRRFHAQTISCPNCGPVFKLYDNRGRPILTEDAVKAAALLIKEGKILAIKGMGGFHLACSALDENIVEKLRQRKKRERKPFAIMVPDVEWLKRICIISRKEEEIIRGRISPILLLKKKYHTPIASNVAPDNRYFGVMLPYSGVHKLLLKEAGIPLIMTSGNFSEEPIIYREEEAFSRLHQVVDFYLIHNREIVTPVDDSIVTTVKGQPVVLRRARGYVPVPFVLKSSSPIKIFATGADLKSTFCMLRENYAFLSQHLGDLQNLPSIERYRKVYQHFHKLLNFTPDLVVHDLHPDYISTKIASEFECPKIALQHHKAHIAAVAAEFGIEEKVIGFSFDGTGYGEDGTIWGGEIFTGEPHKLKRAGTLKPFLLLSSEGAVKEPWRVAFSLLMEILGKDLYKIHWAKNFSDEKLSFLENLFVKKINSPLCSSMGRLFDAVSSLLNLKHHNSFEAEAAMALENIAVEKEDQYQFEIYEKDGLLIMDWRKVILSVVEDLKKKKDPSLISTKFHNAVAHAVAEAAKRIRTETGLNKVILSGGVFQNKILTEKTLSLLEENDFQPFFPSQIPPNDGGISLGQAYIAYLNVREEKE